MFLLLPLSYNVFSLFATCILEQVIKQHWLSNSDMPKRPAPNPVRNMLEVRLNV